MFTVFIDSFLHLRYQVGKFNLKLVFNFLIENSSSNLALFHDFIDDFNDYLDFK